MVQEKSIFFVNIALASALELTTKDSTEPALVFLGSGAKGDGERRKRMGKVFRSSFLTAEADPQGGGKGSGSFFASREKKKGERPQEWKKKGNVGHLSPLPLPPRPEGERWFSGLMKPSSSSSSSPFRSGEMCLLQVLSFAGRVPYFSLPFCACVFSRCLVMLFFLVRNLWHSTTLFLEKRHETFYFSLSIFRVQFPFSKLQFGISISYGARGESKLHSSGYSHEQLGATTHLAYLVFIFEDIYKRGK